MEPRRSLGWPIVLGVVLIGSIIILGVGWVLVSIVAALFSSLYTDSLISVLGSFFRIIGLFIQT